MSIEFKSVIHQACRTVLRPIASMMLRAGLTWREFSELSKQVFVEVATAEYGINGRPTNISRVSILTGISRKEVKRQRELMASSASPARQKTTDATRVLSGWFQDADFLDGDGNPRHLDEKGSGPSFETLCQRYGGGVAAPTMLKELLNTDTIARDSGGNLYPLRRYYQPARHDDENLLWGTNLIRDLAETMNNNIFKTEQTRLRFGGKADDVSLPAACADEFRAFLDQRGQSFLEEIDDWLTQHAAHDDDKPQVRLGVGVFGIEAPISTEKAK
jgi:hypothetical protein